MVNAEFELRADLPFIVVSAACSSVYRACEHSNAPCRLTSARRYGLSFCS